MPGAYVVTLDAEPVLYVERGGKALLALREPTRVAAGRRSKRSPMPSGAVRVPRLGIERFDGEPVVGTEVGARLIELGFRQSPRRLTLSA